MNTQLKNRKILVTGGGGFLGTHVINKLLASGVSQHDLIAPPSSEIDLRRQSHCRQVVKNIDIIIHMAGNVGGIGHNQQNPGSIFYDNIIMGVNLMEEARRANVAKFVAIGSVCAYPKFTSVPFREEDLWEGYPEETNAAYGLAKKMLLVQAQAYRQQYDFDAIYLLLVNLYGPGDNFDPDSSHVIPALIRRFYEARRSGAPEVVVWGTGRATREFLYVEDAARAIVLATRHYDKPDPVNIGSRYEISIHELAHTIAGLVGYKGAIIFDSSKPDGQPRRKIDIARAKREFGFESRTDFTQGLRATIKYYAGITS